MADDLRAFLVRTVLDDAFRELARTDPDAAFEAYDLSPADREVIRERGPAMLRLLGEALEAGDDAVPARPTPRAPPAEAAPVQSPKGDPRGTPVGLDDEVEPLPELPDAELLLRLRPQTHVDDQGDRKILHAASLHPWPPTDGDPGAVAFHLRFTPTVGRGRDGRVQVAYAGSLQSVSPGAEPPPAEPWGHRTDTEAVREATRGVRDADPDDRYQRLLELAAAITEERR